MNEDHDYTTAEPRKFQLTAYKNSVIYKVDEIPIKEQIVAELMNKKRMFLRNDSVIKDFPFEENEPSKILYVLRRSNVIDLKDISSDIYQPWTVKKIYGIFLKEERATRLSSDVLIAYSYKGAAIKLVPHMNSKSGIIYDRLPATVKEEARLLLTSKRPHQVARELSMKHDLNLNSGQMNNVKRDLTVRKESVGIVGKDDIDKFKKEIMNNGWILYRFAKAKEKENIIIEDESYLVINPEAAEMFTNQMPTLKDLEKSQEFIEEFKRMTEERRNQELCRTMDRNVAKGALYLDFTFNMCRKQVGLIGFQNTHFKRNSSQGNPLIILAYIISEVPDAEIMKIAGHLFADFLQKKKPSGRVTAVCSDKEKCLKYFLQDEVFSSCQRLHCSFHFMENIKQRLGDFLGTLIYCRLMGEERNLSRTLGLLDKLQSREEFKDNLQSLLEKYSVPAVDSRWYVTISDELLERYGILARLQGGFGLQPVTNNLIENRNLTMKKDIGPKKMTLQETITQIITNDKAEMNSLYTSIFGLNCDFTTSLGVSRLEGSKLSEEAKYRLAEKLRCSLIYKRLKNEKKYDKLIPPWVLSGISENAKPRLFNLAASFSVDVSNTKGKFFISDAKSSFIVKFEEDKEFVCISCRKDPVCVHKISFLFKSNTVQRAHALDLLQKQLDEETLSQRCERAQTIKDGMKGNYKGRRGSKKSAVVRSTQNMIDLRSQSLEEIS